MKHSNRNICGEMASTKGGIGDKIGDAGVALAINPGGKAHVVRV